jgi:hypothetical protein
MIKMKIKKLPILILMLMIISNFSNGNVVICGTNENLVSIETDSNMWNFNSTFDMSDCNNLSTGNATSGSYANSTIGCIYGQPKPNMTGDGQAKGWMRHSIVWDCPVDNENGVINISYEYGALASLKVNSSGYAYAKLWLTFFIDDIEYEMILYNNTIDTINESDNFNADSIVNWSKNLTLSNRTYTIGVNASYEIEYSGNSTESCVWFIVNVPDKTSEESDGDTEYWAVLIGVDYKWSEFVGYWDAHLSFDEDVEQMKKILLASDPDRWKENHIKVLTNEKATLINIVKAIIWLDSKEDGDDISFIYYTAHGYRVKDLPPYDEEDGYDEFLTTYWTLKNYMVIWDDLFNWGLNKLDSENIAVIIDACYSGGMIDENTSSWINEFSCELNQNGRVIVTSCGENETASTSFGGIAFSHFIMEGLQGYADNSSLCELGNDDSFVSIEEAFNYYEKRYREYFNNDSIPVIFDSDDTSDILLTDVTLPPNIPILYGDNITISQPGTPFVFNASSTDPEENDTIRYGWNWSKDRFCEDVSNIFWGQGGYNVDYWSSYYNSGENCTISHSWYNPGIYAIRSKAQDESGAERIESYAYSGLWSKPKYVIIKEENEVIDQYQLISNTCSNGFYGVAQSFKPNSSNGLSKVKLKFGLSKDFYDNYSKDPIYGDFPINVSIRKNLYGNNLDSVSKIASLELKESKSLFDWIEFDFPNNCCTNVNKTYFIIVEPHANISNNPYYFWVGSSEKDEYLKGESYWKSSPNTWDNMSGNFDHCFITYEALPLIADAGGPYYGLVDETICYKGSASDGVSPYKYYWYFYNLNEVVYLESNDQYVNISYDTPGNYTVKLNVTDKQNNVVNDTTYTVIKESNNQPYTPNKPSGPTICKKEEKYNFSANTTDPDGDPMYYMWDWGDNTTSEWLGPFNSGQIHIASYNWGKWGLYKIKVKAKDVYGNESNWSEEKYVYVRLFPFFSVSPSVYLKSSQTVYFNDYSQSYYEIVNWTWDFGDGNFSYTQNTSHTYAADGFYNVTLTITDNMSASNVSNQQICIDSVNPEISSYSGTPDTAGINSDIDIDVNANDDLSGINIVKINVIYPDDSNNVFLLNNINSSIYELVFNDSWLVGQYNYTIYVFDKSNNSINSAGHSFNISMQGTMSVCTIKDEYGDNEMINLTDPPSGSPGIGYELLDNGNVLRIWNKYDSYYFDTNSGIQLTNHNDEYWSHNVLMLGYYNNDQWNLLYRTDELTGFNKNIECDNETYVNATLWKDLSYAGYDFHVAIRYNLNIDDNELTVIPYIKNIGQNDIPYVLGFGWEIKDIQTDMTTSGDYINVNRTMYYLNQTLNNVYTNLLETEFYLMENTTDSTTKSLYLKWNESLNYKLQVKSREDQYNAPVTLFIKVGTLNAGQEKYTELFWYDAEQITYYFDSFDEGPYGEAWATYPNYMVDGSIANWASTTVNGDVELCDENNCSGTDIGTISKVELRVCSYCPSGQRDTILRPVYGGTNDGMECRYSTSPSIIWSEWFDITYGPYAPQPWGWNDIVSLDCDVVAENDPIGPLFTLKCSRIEIRVTYTPYSPPEISNPYPSNGSNGISVSPTLNISVSDAGGDSMNITWLSNSSGSWHVFGINNSVGNGTYHQVFSNATKNGKWWYWKVNVTDGENYTESNVYKFYTGYQSKIKNIGSTAIKGYLLIQVQYYNTSSSSWVVADDTVNETAPRTVNSSEQFGLDTVFNGRLVNTQNLSSFGDGTYRIYAAFRDPEGNILVTDNETEMIATYEFTITFD